jgi:hypothetical protein
MGLSPKQTAARKDGLVVGAKLLGVIPERAEGAIPESITPAFP